MQYPASPADIAVIGAGHAGVEAALACARLGARTLLFTLSLDSVANMPCNPSIGGTAKGHLVREIDALGGEMGRAADAQTLQSRMLNRGKGPAVHSLRAQVDRAGYHLHMKRILEEQPNLLLRQGEIVDIRLDENGRVSGVTTEYGAAHPVRAVILCTGTYLNAKVFVGALSRSGGPDGLPAAARLTQTLARLGLPLRRFKTGTPARVHRGTVDFSRLEPQPGDEPVTPFSFETREPPRNQILCHIAYTNAETHRVIRENLHRSPLFGGQISGAGARYCPSIEDKIVRFADRDRHQIFVEPMGLHSAEVYLQGASSSLPEDVQLAMLRTVDGLGRVELTRTAYAIEYDCLDPLILRPTLAVGHIPGLFAAGQICGTSGYEEAAAQGLVAGINAARYVLGRSEFVLERSGSYIGTLIDDLTAKGCLDPYRMMTSRSEYRLLLRQDNADARLTPAGRELGLIGDARWLDFERKQAAVAAELARVQKVHLAPSPELNALLAAHGTAPVATGTALADLIRRPELTYDALAPADAGRPPLPAAVREAVELMLKYEGYIRRQLEQAQRLRRDEHRLLPADTDYAALPGLRLEAREKLAAARPRSLGQASRVSGVSPADVAVLHLYLAKRERS